MQTLPHPHCKYQTIATCKEASRTSSLSASCKTACTHSLSYPGVKVQVMASSFSCQWLIVLEECLIYKYSCNTTSDLLVSVSTSNSPHRNLIIVVPQPADSASITGVWRGTGREGIGSHLIQSTIVCPYYATMKLRALLIDDITADKSALGKTILPCY